VLPASPVACRSGRVVQRFPDGWTIGWTASSPMSGLVNKQGGRDRQMMTFCETATWAHPWWPASKLKQGVQ
jgi:hypothetical protein